MILALVNLPKHEDEPPLGLAYIAAYLREYAAFEQTVIVDEDDPVEALTRLKPDLVGISALSFLFPEANRVAGVIKSKLGVPVIAGGYHITTLPHHLEPSHFDIGVMGEGEETMAELIQLFQRQGRFLPEDLRQIPGLVFRNEAGAHELSPPRPLIEPLDRIPMPARDLLRMKERYLVPRKAGFGKLGIYAAMLTSRGCPHQCAFCSPRIFWRKFRSFSPARVVAEAESLVTDYRVDGIMIWDDLFTANRRRLAEIAEGLERRRLTRRTQFCVFAKADLMDEEMALLLRRMNVTSVIFGLESGSDPVLKYLKKGGPTVEDNYRALRLCKRHGMRTHATLIIGAPDETEEDVRKTAELVRHPDLDQAVICHLTPLPGTEVWNLAKQQGLVSEAFDWPYQSLEGWGFHPGLVLSRHLRAPELETWYNRIQEDVDRKRFGEKTGTVRLKYLLHPHVLERLGRNWKRYARNAVNRWLAR